MEVVRGSRRIQLMQKVKSVKILPSGTQFQGASPANITLKAVASNFEADKYAWYKGDSPVIVGTNQQFVIANNQVNTIENYKVVVTDLQNNIYQDTISITKVNDGSAGRPGRIPIQREWKQGDIYRNNDDVIDYIYHRPTNTWWRLKDGFNNVVAGANPSNAFTQLTGVEQLAVQLIIAEQANIAGFIFKDNKLVSQTPSPTDPNLTLDGLNGTIKANNGIIGNFTLDKEGFRSNRNIIESYYVEDVSTDLTNDGSLTLRHSSKWNGNTQKFAGFLQRRSGQIDPSTPVLELSSNRDQAPHAPPYENICLRLYAAATGNVGSFALDIVGGYIRVNGNVGVSGTYVFGNKTVTITNGIITKVI